jgi:tetratricopeptide (TPR) repeat protein
LVTEIFWGSDSVRAELRGPFRVFDKDGTDRTPKGGKERALLALLLLAPGQKRTRAWVQSKLWSDRSAEQASVSCRQALANVRKALGPLSDNLNSDRTALWLDPKADISRPTDAGDAELLDDLDVRDPEFDSWLRDVRQRQHGEDGHRRAHAAEDRSTKPVVDIHYSDMEQTAKGRFLARSLALMVADELSLAGDIEVRISLTDEAGKPEDEADASVVVETLGEAETWYVLVRAYGRGGHRCLWTGRLRLPMRMEAIWDAFETTHLVTRAVSAVTEQIALSSKLTPFAAIQRAVRRVYDFDRTGLESAETLLRTAQQGDASGLALAWRGFVRLTAALEFRDSSAELRDEAVDFCGEAIDLAPRHPVVLALASQVQMKLNADYELGHHLALRGVGESDRNPYALHALSQALFFRGEMDKGHRIADQARHAAAGMPNSFSWDMQCCLSALGLGLYDDAIEQATASNRKMPTYRPALRYLVALHLLQGSIERARHYAARLKVLEPDFSPRLLLSPVYPVDTFRALGLVETIRDTVRQLESVPS